MFRTSHFLPLVLLMACLVGLPAIQQADAFSFRVSQVPNGSVFSCNTCHTNGGGTPRNPFGLDVQTRFLIGGNVNWGPQLAALDSDGDGFSNGVELGDPDGDGVADPNAEITNPGNASSFPTIVIEPAIEIDLMAVATGLSSPVAAANAGDGSNRVFVCEQEGVIRILENEQLLPAPFLDIRDKVINLNPGYDERGLLGLAFHPEYAVNGRFFVYYSASSSGSGNHTSIVAEYMDNPANRNEASLASERIIMEIPQPEGNHNGGQLAFGPDGYLYIGLGDGGGANDAHGSIGNGQDTSNLLGTILRIDIDSGDPYGIPSDNPFVGVDGRDEIWAYGLRNPWKFSFDRGGSHQLFCADVGQNLWEEVDIIEKGGNYGWRVMEGSHCFNPSSNCDQTGKILPIAEYDHSFGSSITGGYVYRRSPDSELYGNYVFGDWTGKLLYLDNQNNWELKEFSFSNNAGLPSGTRILSFAEDELGDIYVLTTTTIGPSGSNDTIYKIKVAGEVLHVPSWSMY